MSTNLIPADQVDDEFVNLIVVYNCMDMKDRELSKLIHDPRKTLADYMVGLPDPEKWSVSVNGELFDVEEWKTLYPAKGDYITLMPIPLGGDKSKSVLRLAAMVAISIAAPYMVPATWGATATAAAVAGINMAGALVVNALLPMPKPSTPGYGDSSESPTYGVDGAKNTSTEQTSVPLIYGEFRYAGNIVNLKTVNVDDTQNIIAQMVVSEGQIESITDFEVQDQPIANYEDVETIVRLGGDNQSISGWFADTTRMINKAVTLSPSYTTHLTTGEVDGFRIDLLFPGGLSEVNKKDGKRINRTVNFAIEYQRQGTTQWNSIAPKQYRSLTGTNIVAAADRLRVEYQQRIEGTGSRDVVGNLFVRVGTGAWVLKQTKTHTVSLSSGSGFLSGSFSVALDDMASGSKSYKIEWTGASPTVTASTRYAISPSVTAKTGQPLRRSFQSPVLQEGVYNIRIRRLNEESTDDLKVDRVTLTDVAEIVNERVRYNHTAYYGVNIRLSDQLSGMPRITALVKGIKVKQYDYSGAVTQTAWSNNPAWITLDMLTNTRYGAGLPLSRIDIRMFVEWAEFCRVNKLTFNGVFDSISNVWDACQVVLRVGHARFTSIGNIYSLTIYRASEPVMMFGTGSIIEGTLQLSWQSLEDRANEFEVEYFDRENKNKPAIVRVVNEKALARGEPQRISTVRMVGIDNQKQALHEAHFQKAINENLIMTGQFEATVESLACGVGDVVLIQHDMPDWGESGRIKPESTTTLINVDRPLEISASPSDISFLILHPAVIRGTGVVSNVNNSKRIIYLTGLSTSIRAKRIKIGSKDLPILAMSASGGYLEVVLESTAGLAIGNAVELWDTDVIETRKVQAYDAAKMQLRLAGPLSIVPQDFANYMVGKSNLTAKPVSITGISGNGEYKRLIKFIEYNHTVFDPENAQPTPIYSRPITAVQHVRDLRVLEEVTMRTGSLTSDIVVSWLKPADGNYAGAQVYMSRNGGPLLRHGTAAAGATVYHTTAVFGETLVFKVVAYDGAGRVADFDTAPIFSYNVTKSSDLPPVVQNFRATLSADGVELMWDWITDPDVVGYEIREGVSWDVGKKLVTRLASNRFFSTEKNHSYIYWIKATDVTGKQSPAASMATVTDLLKPAMPTSVDIETSSFTIKLMPNGLSPGALWEFRRSNSPLATSKIESNAIKVGQGTELVDTGLSHGTTYYYYIRGVNAFAVGDWYPVSAATKTDIPEILDALAGQVRESHLWGELNKRINLIDGPASLTGSVAQRVAKETQDRVDALTAEASARAEAVSKEAFDRAAAINAERSARVAAVTAEAAARAAAISKEQGDRASAISAEAAARNAAINAEATARASAISAEANSRSAEINAERVARQNALSAEATARAAAITKEQGDRAAAINSERSQRISGDGALSNTIDTLTSVVNKNIADIATEKKTRSDADGALASEITSIIAKIEAMPSWVNGFEGDDYNAWSADSGHTISSLTSGAFIGTRSARISSSTSTAGDFEGIKVKLPLATGDAFLGQKIKISATARWNRTSGYSSREFAIAYVTTDGTAITTSGWQRFSLSSNWQTHSFHYTVPLTSSGHDHYLVLWGDTSGSNLQAFVDQCVIQPSDVDMSVVEAAILEERTVRVSAEEALSERIDTVNSRVNSANSAINSEATARANADTALTNTFNGALSTLNTNVMAAISSEASTRASQDSALTTSINNVNARVNTANANITKEEKARADADTALTNTFNSSLSTLNDNVMAAISSEASTRASEDAALTTNINNVNARVNTANANITKEEKARADADTALTNTFNSSLSTLNTNVMAAISSEATTRANKDSALTTSINNVNARVDTANSNITKEEKARADADTALTNTFNSSLSTLNTNVMAAISSEASTRASADSALTTSINNVNSRVNAANASIASEATTRANADTALTNSFNSSLSSLNTELRGVITSESSTRAANDSALASQINTVQSQMGDSLAAAISEVETVVNGASLVKNGMFSTGTLAGWPGTWGQVSVVNKSEGDAIAANAPAHNMAMFADRDHSSHRYLYGTYFPVTEGDEYTVRVDYAASSGATIRFDVFVQWRKEADGTSVTNSFLTSDASPEWKRTAPRSFKVPAGATQGRVYIRRRSGYEGVLYLTNIVNYRLDDAMSSKIDTVQSSLQGDVAGVQTNLNTQVARVDGRVDAVSSNVSSLTTKVNKNTADIVSESTTRSNADAALSTQINSVLAKANANAASITSEAKSRADGDSALSTQINSVLTKANANAASITNESKARSDGDSALSTQINSVLSKANANTAAINTEATARANADNALSTTISAVSTKANNNAAAIVTERNARTSADNALSSQINTVQATLGDAISSARVEAESSANGSTIVKNGMFGTGDMVGWPSSWNEAVVVEKREAASFNAERTIPTRYAVLLPDTGHDALRYLNGDYFPVTEGDEYTFRADFAGGVSGVNVSFRFYVQWRNDVAATNEYNFFTTNVNTLNWSRTDARTFKVPVGATRGRILIRRETGGSGRLYITNILGYRSDDAMSSLITTVQSSMNSNIAGVQTNLNTQVNRLDGRVDTVASSVSTVLSKANSNQAAITSEATTRANADSALSSQINTAQSALNGQISSVQQSLSTSISNVDKRVDGMADTTNLVTNGSFYTGDTTGWISVSSAISMASGVSRGTVAANYAMRFPDDEVSYSPRSSGVPVRAGEKFSVSFDFAHGNTGASNRFRAFVQWLNSDGTTESTHYGVTENASFVWKRYGPHVFTAPDNATSARFGIQRLGLNSGVGYATNMVANRIDSVLGAQYTLKLDVNGFISGFGAYNDGTTSDFGVIANRFYIAAPGSTTGAMPFLVSGNSVYINEALIQTLTIGKLRTSTGGVVVENNRIKANYIDAANLDVRSSARFTGDVQSSNFVAGSTGWRIRQNGSAEFNQGQFNGTLNVGSGTLGDDVTIAGVDSLKLIRERAYAGSLSKARVDDWVRPGSTRIDGNKIFTGDAYVDTLQIKGDAVTVAGFGNVGSSSFIDNGQWVTACQIDNYSTDGASGFFVGTLGFVATDSDTSSYTWPRATVSVSARLLRDGTVIKDFGVIFTETQRGSQKGTSANGDGGGPVSITVTSRGTISVSCPINNVGGQYNYYFQVLIFASDSRSIKNRHCFIMGRKR